MSRFEVREQRLSARVSELSGSEYVHVVWDTVADKAVTFGRYLDKEHAQRRLRREEEKDT